jgi:predicted glycosyltransferase
MIIWIDITNTPHVNVLLPIIRHLKNKHEFIITARDFTETIPLLRENGINPIVYGRYKGKSRVKKIFGLFQRMWVLFFRLPKFDLAFSLGGNYTSTIAFLRRKKSIVFSDNDISFKFFSFAMGSYFIFPSYFRYGDIKRKYRLKDEQIYTFHGFKEDIYIANFSPDLNFKSQLPFDDFITIRPENLKASYVPTDSVTIVPELFRIFKNENILFLPRYEEEKKYADGLANVWYPEKPLSGLNVCYNTKAMLTGAGTFAREAALLGVPAVSFFPSHVFLTVDTVMQEMGIEFKSRNPEEIKEYVDKTKRRSVSIERSKEVLEEVLKIIDGICKKVENKLL